MDTEAEGHRVAFNEAFKQKGTALLSAVISHTTAGNRELDATSKSNSRRVLGLASYFLVTAIAIAIAILCSN